MYLIYEAPNHRFRVLHHTGTIHEIYSDGPAGPRYETATTLDKATKDCELRKAVSTFDEALEYIKQRMPA